MSLISLALVIFEIVGMYKVFEKLGEDGWKAIIPYLNQATMLKVGKKNPWALILRIAGDFSFIMGMFIFMIAASTDGADSAVSSFFALVFLVAFIVLYIVYIVIAFHAYQNICEQLGQSVNYAWLFLFFPAVMWIIAGFDDKWEPDEATIAYLNQQQADKKNKNHQLHGARNADAYGNQRPMDAQYTQPRQPSQPVKPAQPSQPRPPAQPAQQTQQTSTMDVKPVTVKPVEPINIQPVTVKPVQMPDDSTKNTADNKTDNTPADK